MSIKGQEVAGKINYDVFPPLIIFHFKPIRFPLLGLQKIAISWWPHTFFLNYAFRFFVLFCQLLPLFFFLTTTVLLSLIFDTGTNCCLLWLAFMFVGRCRFFLFLTLPLFNFFSLRRFPFFSCYVFRFTCCCWAWVSNICHWSWMPYFFSLLFMPFSLCKIFYRFECH